MTMYIASANHTADMKNLLTISCDIANTLGLNPDTVRQYLGTRTKAKPETRKNVLMMARDKGFHVGKRDEAWYEAEIRKEEAKIQKRAAERKMKEDAKNPTYWRGGNFRSHKEEVARMLALREEGFSNAEIAKKLGRVIITVRRNIGVQPADMTKENRVQGVKNRWAKETRRKAYVQSHKVVEHNELVKKVNEVGEKIRANMAEMDTLRKTHMELVAKVANAEADIRKVAEKMGMTVVEVAPVVVPMTEANAVVQTSFLN